MFTPGGSLAGVFGSPLKPERGGVGGGVGGGSLPTGSTPGVTPTSFYTLAFNSPQRSGGRSMRRRSGSGALSGGMPMSPAARAHARSFDVAGEDLDALFCGEGGIDGELLL